MYPGGSVSARLSLFRDSMVPRVAAGSFVWEALAASQGHPRLAPSLRPRLERSEPGQNPRGATSLRTTTVLAPEPRQSSLQRNRKTSDRPAPGFPLRGRSLRRPPRCRAPPGVRTPVSLLPLRAVHPSGRLRGISTLTSLRSVKVVFPSVLPDGARPAPTPRPSRSRGRVLRRFPLRRETGPPPSGPRPFPVPGKRSARLACGRVTPA